MQGRILLLEMEHPDVQGRVWFVGLNQHVAANGAVRNRELVLSTLSHLVSQAAAHGWRLILIGDANAAPMGGRWGYSCASRTQKFDQQMDTWLAQTQLHEVSTSPLQATWKACLLPRKAVLDRAWVYPADLPVERLQVRWEVVQPLFDHAMIMLRLAHSVAGVGFAGASRPLHQPAPVPRCRVNMRKFREPSVRNEWSRLGL